MHFLLENVSSCMGITLVFGFYLLSELFACLYFKECFMRYRNGLVEHWLTVQMVLYFLPLFHSVHFKEQAPCLTCWNLVTANYYACSFQLHKWKSNHGPCMLEAMQFLGKIPEGAQHSMQAKFSQHWHWVVLEMEISPQKSKGASFSWHCSASYLHFH